MITFDHVSRAYDGVTVLDDVSFQIAPGEFVCITGHSGAGKSTIVNLLIRADLPSAGVIEVDGADIGRLPVSVLQVYRQKTGVVFQDYKLLPDRTVAENVAYALEISDEPSDVINEKVFDILSRLGIADRADAFPHELSGGEEARTALARALIRNPNILIADEPTGNVDSDQARGILGLLKAANATGTTVILATHDPNLVTESEARVIHIERGKIMSDSGTALASVVPAQPPSVPTVDAVPASQPPAVATAVAQPTSIKVAEGEVEIPVKEQEPVEVPKKKGGFRIRPQHVKGIQKSEPPSEGEKKSNIRPSEA